MTPALRPSRAYVTCQVVGWSAYGLLGVGMSVLFRYGNARVIVTTLIGVVVAAVATHLWRGVIVRRGLLGLPFGRLLPRLVAGVAGTALATELLVWSTGLFVTHAYTLATSTPGVMVATTANWVFTMLLWTAIYVGAEWFARWRDSEIRRLGIEVTARDAQLDALRAQLQPHFLFNAMNVLRALISEDPARARDLITELSELMRYALQAGRRERVALAEELAVVESYLRVESVRYEERLAWRVDAEPAASVTSVPPMLLQMLVENAVKHGIAASERGGEIVVTARRQGDRVFLQVTNPGVLGTNGGTRIGLANSRERLRLLYGDRASLSLEARDGLVVAEAVLPAEEAR